MSKVKFTSNIKIVIKERRHSHEHYGQVQLEKSFKSRFHFQDRLTKAFSFAAISYFLLFLNSLMVNPIYYVNSKLNELDSIVVFFQYF